VASCKEQGKIQARAQIAPHLRAFFETGAANNRAITGEKQEEAARQSFLRADHAARQKTRSGIPRGPSCAVLVNALL
jgi:hypothetical protein